ncbi:MAG: CPBP family intramembrane metalloprotease [Paludibacteraceae bacterium]
MKHIEYAFDDKNEFWRYIVVIILTFLISNTIGAIPLGILIIIGMFNSGNLHTTPQNMMDFSAYGIDQNVGLAAMLITFVIALGGFILLQKSFHKRTLQGTINGTGSIRWKRLFNGFALWSVFMILSLIATLIIDPSSLEFQLKWSAFIPLFFISLTLIPFQTAFEEITFRGYLMQGLATNTKSRIWALIITSLAFGLLHSFNPEVKEYGFFATMPSYIGFGVIFGLITLLDDGVELAIGLHAANNFFSSILVTSPYSALVTAAIYTTDKVNPYVDMLTLYLFGIIAIAVFSKKYKWNWNILTRKVEKPIDIKAATAENQASEA